MAQTTRNQVGIQKQAFFKIPIRPLAEQHRIGVKVEALMALSDRLLQAHLHEALDPPTEAVTEEGE